jgi:hypothetical protein
MTAEQFDISQNENQPEISSEFGKTIGIIVDSIKTACIPFKKAASQSNLKKPLNENKLTQILVEQIEVKIKTQYGIGVKNQYSDLFYGTKGIPDFYFHIVEEGVTHEPLFIVESKRLPSPNYEKEYVIGDNKNGGIERFKIEKHGKGISQCGIVGFIENYSTDYWMKTINCWIIELSQTKTNWYEDEVLIDPSCSDNYCYAISNAKRLNSDPVLLHHFWIVL